jgi:CRISPR-associated protein Csm1
MEVLATLDAESDSLLSQQLIVAAQLATGPGGHAGNTLQSIFNGLGPAQGTPLVVPPVPAALTDAAFARPATEVKLPLAIWSLMEKELTRLPAFQTAAALTETLLAVWQRLACHLPAVGALPDVALCDQLASTAALAVALNGADPEQTTAAPALLVGADLSGIQLFLYDIAGTKAAKNLKGRSHYLHLLAETVLRRLLTALDLTSASVVYASGGGFYVLAPHSAATLAAVSELRTELGLALFEAHQTSLFLSLAATPVTSAQLRGGRVHEPWQHLTRQLSRQKAQRFAERLEPDYALFFEPTEVGGEQARDAISGEELGVGQLTFPLERYVEKEELTEPTTASRRIGAATEQQVRLGQQLPRADATATTTTPLSATAAQAMVEPAGLGLRSWLGPAADSLNALGPAPTGTLHTLNEPDFLSRFSAARLVTPTALSLGFTYYGGNDFPRGDDGYTIRTFDEFAGRDNDEVKFKRLGVLRMDVDNLGQLFINGFAEGQRVFARYATLSRTLDFFFKGYLNTIWNENERFRSSTFILYSGGDDLFIVGKWDVVIELATRIRQEFRRYTGQHPGLGLSGGVAVVGARFPIAKAAGLADEAEKRAKGHRWQATPTTPVVEKDSFDLLGLPLNWQHEFPLVQQLKEELRMLLASGMPRSLLQRIQALHEQAAEARRTGQPERWRWLMAYDFARAAERLPRDQSAGREFLQKIQQAALTNRYDQYVLPVLPLPLPQHSFLTLLNLAARWAALEGRS